MKTMLIIATGVAVLAAAPALGDPGGKGKGKGQAKAHDRAWVDHGQPYRADYRAPLHRAAAPGCPPGLAKKGNGCMPPGQAKRLWSQGQRVPSGYQYWTPYNQLPQRYINQYGLDPDDRYIYRDGYIYQVDPRTRIVEQILSALVR